MMTPEERYALQAVLADLEAAAGGIRALLDLGENPHLTREYKINLEQMQAAAGGPVCLCGLSTTVPCPRHPGEQAEPPTALACRCEFGWQPECPQHGTPEHRLTRDPQDFPPDEHPCTAPDHTPGNACTPPEDHQDERPHVSTFAPANHERHWAGCDHSHGPESWCATTPQAVIDRHNALLSGGCRKEHPHEGACFVYDDHIVSTAEEAEAGYQRRLMKSHRPTPKDVFGAHGEEDQVGG